MLLLIHKFDWRIILVNGIYYEDGPKKPLKSISVKPVVLASYAQFGASAGGNEILGDRNGIRSRPNVLGDLVLW